MNIDDYVFWSCRECRREWATNISLLKRLSDDDIDEVTVLFPLSFQCSHYDNIGQVNLKRPASSIRRLLNERSRCESLDQKNNKKSVKQ